MTGKFRMAAIALALVACSGCTTMRTLEETSPAAIRESVKRGDRVVVAATDGKVYDVEVTRVGAESLSGTADNGKRWKIPFKAIETIEVQEVSVARSLGVGVGTLYVVSIVAVAVMLHNLDIHFDLCE